MTEAKIVEAMDVAICFAPNRGQTPGRAALEALKAALKAEGVKMMERPPTRDVVRDVWDAAPWWPGR